MDKSSEISNYLTDEASIEKRTALFNKYVYPYRNLIYHICIIKTLLLDNIRDNYNEVLINFYKYVSSYNPQLSIKTWIYAVATRCLFCIENKRNRFQRTGDVGAIDLDQIADSVLDEDDQTANHISLDNYRELFSDDVLSTLESLKPTYREALILQLAGYKLEEITKILHEKGSLKSANVETTKSRIFLAKKQLRELLTRDGKRK